MVRWTLNSGVPGVAGPGARGAVRGAGFLGRVRGGRTGDAQGAEPAPACPGLAELQLPGSEEGQLPPRPRKRTGARCKARRTGALGPAPDAGAGPRRRPRKRCFGNVRLLHGLW